VKRREGKLREFARAIRATIIHPSDASARMEFARVVRWRNTTRETDHYRGVSIYTQVNQYFPCARGKSRDLSAKGTAGDGADLMLIPRSNIQQLSLLL